MIRGAIFDLDGTLLDSMEIWEHAGEWYLQDRGITAEPGLGTKLYAMNMVQAAEYLKERYGLTDTIERIIDSVNQRILRYYREEVQTKPGVLQALECLRGQGVHMTIATSSDRVLAEAALARHGLMQYFERIFTCSEEHCDKSSPDIYLAACAAMRTAPEKTCVFEDALHAVQTAAAAGFRVTAIYDPASAAAAEELRKTADDYFMSFWELTEDWIRQ